MTFNSQAIPKELLKFRLNKQLIRLRQIFTNFTFSSSEIIDSYSSGEEEKEDKFQLYQRVLSWFIMGRLAKSEYDAILENLLVGNELIGKVGGFESNFIYNLFIEIHNKIIELLRAIYCDSVISGGSSSNLLSTVEIDGNNLNVFNSFAFEFSLLPAEEADLPEKDAIPSQCDDPNVLEYVVDDIALTPASTPFLSNPKVKEFQTSIDNLNF